MSPQLDHRHYNARLIAFDDLVGFPYPEDGGGALHRVSPTIRLPVERGDSLFERNRQLEYLAAW